VNTIWRKIWRDLAHRGNRARTALVVLSIAVGVFGLGTIFGGHGVMKEYLAENHEAWIPIHMTFWGNPFDRAVEEVVLREPAVAKVERMVDTGFRWKLEGEPDWRNGGLLARADYENQIMGRVDLWEGQWPTGRALAIERQTARHYGIPIGTTILVQFGQRERRLEVVGVVRDSFADPVQFGADPIFFATPETATWLTGDDFNRIDVRLATYNGKEDAQAVIDRLAERIERVGMHVNVWGSWLRDPNEHWFQEDVDAVFVILVVLGVLALALSGFLVINTMNALISQQVWQIGVMKVVGATFGRVARVYLATALIYGGLALLLAIPAGAVGAHLLAYWILDIANITVDSLRVVPWAVGLQVVVGLLVPLGAAAVPVIGGARITAHRAISTYGLGGGFGRGWLDQLIGKVRRLPRPVALSLRNTFRRKARVVLTLLTLVLGGAMFMMVISVEASLDNTVDLLLREFGYDVSVWFDRSYRVDRLIEVSEGIPGVVKAEVWRYYGTMLKLRGGGEHYIALRGVPPESEILHPRITRGRMLAPGDGYAIVLNHKIAVDEGIRVGDEVKFDIEGKETTWTVVGLIQSATSDHECGVPFDTLAREIGSANYGNNVRVLATAHDAASQKQLARVMNDAYTAQHLEVDYVYSSSQMREESSGGFNIILYLLLSMAGLAAVVGSIGMMSTMSINVIERRREIGVMRATGAMSAAIASIFVVEGVLLGALSWLFAVPLSVPGARLLSDTVGNIIFETPFEFVYSIQGMALWLAIVIVLSAMASLWPALKAAQVSVRESLAYE